MPRTILCRAVATPVFLVALLVMAPLSCVTASHNDTSQRESSAAYRKAHKLSRTSVKFFVVPVLGVSVTSLTDTWGEARSSGRTHEGIDIIAPRGSVVVSPTKAVVVRIGTDTLGGNVVYTANPGGERFYFAHLNTVKKGLKVGQELRVGDVIGYVGNTGNASSTVPHLHFGIYKNGATNPFPRITKRLSASVERAVLSKEAMLLKQSLAKKQK